MGMGLRVAAAAAILFGILSAPPAMAEDKPVTLLAAGDIAACKPHFLDKLIYRLSKGRKMKRGSHKTARLLDRMDGTIIALGDLAHPHGKASEFKSCYEPTWGRHKHRTYPAPGNHDYRTYRAEPYFAYFGERAGPSGRGYYSFDLGAWHIISLNSNIKAGRKSKQMKWLRADLAKTNARCILAYWHHPVFSSGGNGNLPIMRHAYKALYDAGASLVLAGHDHIYERFAPQDVNGRLDRERGIRAFVVGTGGVPLGRQRRDNKNSEVVQTGIWGILKLTLHDERYDWDFVTVGDHGEIDSGSAACVERDKIIQAAK